MRGGGSWQAASMVAAVIATCAASDCAGPCSEELEPLESGEYTIVERLYGGDEASDDWLQAVLPEAKLSIDRASNTATLVYERDGTTYQVVFTLEK